MKRRQSSAGFRNDIGMRQVFFLANFINVIDNVVGVFLNRIVCAGSIG